MQVGTLTNQGLVVAARQIKRGREPLCDHAQFIIIGLHSALPLDGPVLHNSGLSRN
jgi:hypothetical protein